jgi:hypothetical protein
VTYQTTHFVGLTGFDRTAMLARHLEIDGPGVGFDKRASSCLCNLSTGEAGHAPDVVKKPERTIGYELLRVRGREILFAFIIERNKCDSCAIYAADGLKVRALSLQFSKAVVDASKLNASPPRATCFASSFPYSTPY